MSKHSERPGSLLCRPCCGPDGRAANELWSARSGPRQRSSGRRPAEAAAEFRRAVNVVERLSVLQPDGYNLYNLACFRSLLSGVGARSGSGLTDADVSQLGEKAVESLRQAVSAGLEDVAFMRRDTDLDLLRSRPDFQLLLMDLTFPGEPFAR